MLYSILSAEKKLKHAIFNESGKNNNNNNNKISTSRNLS